MKLDSRIIEGKKPFDCTDAESEAVKSFIGKKGYFADHISEFKNISDLTESVLKDITPDFLDYEVYDAGCTHWQYFLPAEWVKGYEKKYRPFTPDEFTDTFTIGEPIIFRRKQSKRLYEYNVLFIGCCFSGDNTDVVLGNDRFSLETLFNNYEWRQHGSYEWKPFGIIEE